MPVPYPPGARAKLVRARKEHACVVCGERIDPKRSYVRVQLIKFRYNGAWAGTDIDDAHHLTCFEMLDQGYASL